MKEKELENKRWYRLYKVIAILIVVATFLVPSFRNGFSEGSFIDGMISAVIWTVILIILQKVVVYIILFMVEKETEKLQDKSTKEKIEVINIVS